jgi:hypothetical protein
MGTETRFMPRAAFHIIPAPGFLPVLFLLFCTQSLFPQSANTDSSSTHPVASFSTDVYHLYSESADSKEISFTGTRFTANAQAHFGSHALLISLEKQKLSLTDYNKLNGLFFSLAGDYQECTFAYHGTLNLISLSSELQCISTPQQQFINYQAGAGISIQDNAPPLYEISVRRNRYPFDFSIAYSTEKMELINPVGFFSVEQWCRYTLGNTTFGMGYLTASPLPESHEFAYSINNDATVSGWRAEIISKHTGTNYYSSFSNLNCKSSIDGNNNSLLFSNTILNYFYYYNLNLGWETTRGGRWYKLEAEVCYADGKLVGHIESWPFSSVVQSLFINREYYRFSGVLQLERVTGATVYSWKNLEVLPELSLIRIVPHLQIETWRPQFLVFGMTDYANSSLDIKEAGLAWLSVKCSWSIASALITIQANQVSPLYTVKEEKPAGAAASAPSQAGRHVVDGGRWFTAAVQWRF